jgi:ADP-ribose pyrophosphatase YjhB (NUDIX family)
MKPNTKKKVNGWLPDKDYDFIYSHSPRLCIDLVIKDRRGVLFALRDIEPHKDRWHLPGGRVRWREPILDAIRRIAKQELNILVEVIKMLGHVEYLRECQNGSLRHTVSIVFLVKVAGGIPENCWQSKKIAFFKVLPKKIQREQGKFLAENNLL